MTLGLPKTNHIRNNTKNNISTPLEYLPQIGEQLRVPVKKLSKSVSNE